MPTVYGDLTYPTVEDIPLRHDGQGTHLFDKRSAKGRWWGIYVRRSPAAIFRGKPTTFLDEAALLEAEGKDIEPETTSVID